LNEWPSCRSTDSVGVSYNCDKHDSDVLTQAVHSAPCSNLYTDLKNISLSIVSSDSRHLRAVSTLAAALNKRSTAAELGRVVFAFLKASAIIAGYSEFCPSLHACRTCVQDTV